MIAVVLDAAPIEYQALLTAEQRIKGATVTLSDLQVVMNQYWRQTKSAREKDKTNDESELTLAVFEGICFLIVIRKDINSLIVLTKRKQLTDSAEVVLTRNVLHVEK